MTPTARDRGPRGVRSGATVTLLGVVACALTACPDPAPTRFVALPAGDRGPTCVLAAPRDAILAGIGEGLVPVTGPPG